MKTIVAAGIVGGLALPVAADPHDKLPQLIELESSKPAVVGAMFGMTETELAKKGYDRSHQSFKLDDEIVAWPELDAKQRVNEVVLRFKADYRTTLNLLVKHWGPAKLAEDVMIAKNLPRRTAIWWWAKPRIRAWLTSETTDEVAIRFAAYRPLDSIELDKLFGLRRARIIDVEKRLNVKVELNQSFEGETATFRLGYTELGDIDIHGELDGDRLDNVVLVLMCPIGTMKKLIARVRRIGPKLKLAPTHEDILEVRRR